MVVSIDVCLSCILYLFTSFPKNLKKNLLIPPTMSYCTSPQAIHHFLSTTLSFLWLLLYYVVANVAGCWMHTTLSVVVLQVVKEEYPAKSKDRDPHST